MIIVSDTSPLTALLQIEQADLLSLLFGKVLIPPAVEKELLRDHERLPGWLEVQSPSVLPSAISEEKLDAGETEALALALEVRADTVLMDERLGRRVALKLGLRVTGVLGVLVLAKRNGFIDAVGPLILDLQEKAGCWLAEELINEVLRQAGEADLRSE